jgi:zinc and cadmium transporter
MDSDWLLLLAAALIGSVVSLVGGILLLVWKVPVSRIQKVAIPFAAGALLAAAFIELLPEAIESGEPRQIAMYALGGFLIFFILERFLGWFHHHHASDDKHHHKKATSSLIIVGDTVHNLIDGLALGAAFLADPALGFVTAIAIAAHEIPQEVGDFGVLLSLGMRRRNVLIVNLVSALATVIGAVTVYALGSSLSGLEPLLLAGTAGFFIYIAASDLIPTIHDEPSIKIANMQTLIVLIGITVVSVSVVGAHSLLPEEAHGHESSQHHDEEHHDE